MRTVVIEAPAPVVSWEEADSHIRLDGDLSQQTYVESLIEGVTAHLDGPDGWLGRAIGLQTLEARFHGAVSSRVRLRYPPLIQLVSVKVLGSDGVEQEKDVADFRLAGEYLMMVSSSLAWPWASEALQDEAIRVQYRAGFETPPAPIKLAILQMVADLYEQRETFGPASLATIPMPATAQLLLEPFRKFY